MALLNYEFDRQLELERADAYAEGFLRGYKKGFEKEMRKQMVFNMYEEGYLNCPLCQGHFELV